MAYCPNISDEQVVKEFNSIVTHFGGKPLSIEEFKDISLRDSREGIDKKAMESAYYLWNKYAGNLVAIQNDGNYKDIQIKPGVSELFESNPELASIGTQEQYSQYLDTIFPDSKVKDIVYHATTHGKFDNFDKDKVGKTHDNWGAFGKGFYFTDNIESALKHIFIFRGKKTVLPVLLNTINPVIENNYTVEADKDGAEYTESLLQKGNDGVIGEYKEGVSEMYSNEYVVFEPEQIHILGSKQDIEGFKEFVNKYAGNLVAIQNDGNYSSKQGIEKLKSWINSNKSNVQYQLPQDREQEEFVASEKTIRDLSARMADRIGLKVRYESDRTKDYKGKLEGDTAVINLAYATLDTPIHEILGHPIIRALKTGTESNKQLYQNLLKELKYGKAKEVLDRIKRDYVDKNFDIIENLAGSEIFKTRINTLNNELKNIPEFPKAEDFKIIKSNVLKSTFDLSINGKSLGYIKQDVGYFYWTRPSGSIVKIGQSSNVNDAFRKGVLKTLKKEFNLKYNILELNKKISKFSEKITVIKNVGDTSKGLYYLTNESGDNLGNYSIEELKTIIGEENVPKYSLEEQQEEAIVELLGLMTADKLDNVKDGKLISLLKRLLKEMKAFMKSLINQKEVKIDKLPDNMTLGDIADLLAYSNSKLILPGNEVVYTTPDNQQFKTYAEASKHISDLAKSLEDVDLNAINLDKPLIYKGKEIEKYSVYEGTEAYEPANQIEIWYKDGTTETLYEDYNFIDEVLGGTTTDLYQTNTRGFNNIKDFIEKNKQYEQSKEIVEEWKKVNNIQYNPEEVYSRGQEFVSVVGAYSDFDVNLMMQNLLQHIEDNKKAGGEFTISAFTKPVDRTIEHLEGGGGKIKFKIYPQPKDILWAANTDVYSGSVWDASEKVNRDKKSELLGVSYTKYPSLNNINSVQPNLASIIDNLKYHHNELGIVLTGNNFRLEYNEDIPYSTKKVIDSINSILDQKYGKLVKPDISKKPYEVEANSQEEINSYLKQGYKKTTFDHEYNVQKMVRNGIQPTQTNETLKESIESVKSNQLQRKTAYSVKEGNILRSEGWESVGFNHELEEEYFEKPNTKEYTDQALINTKIAKLKEVAKKYPRSLIRSEVRPINSSPSLGFTEDELPFQKVSGKSTSTILEERSSKYLIKELGAIKQESLTNHIARKITDLIVQNPEENINIIRNKVLKDFKEENLELQKLTQEEIEEEIDVEENIKDLEWYNAILNNFDTISRIVNIKVQKINNLIGDVNDDIDIELTEIQDNEKVFNTKSSYEEKLSLSAAVKRMFVGMELPYKNVQDEFETLDYNIVDNVVKSIVAGLEPDFDIMMQALLDNVVAHPWLNQLVNKLKNSDKKTQNLFVTEMNMHYVEHYMVLWRKDKSGFYLSLELANEGAASDNIFKDWQGNLAMSSNVNSDGILTNKQELMDSYDKLSKNPNKDDARKWLEDVGVIVNDKLWDIITKGKYKVGKKEFTFDSFVKTGPMKYINARIKNSGNSSIEEYNILDDNSVKNLAKAQTKYIGNLSSNSHRAGNKTVYSYGKNKYLIDFVRELKRTDLANEILKQGAIFNENSKILNAFKNKDEVFTANFKIATASLQSIKKLGAQNKDNMELHNLNEDEYEMQVIGGLHSPIEDVTGNGKRVGLFNFLTTSDKSTSMQVKMLAEDIKLDNNGDLMQESLDKIYDQLVLPEIRRIKQYENIKKTNLAFPNKEFGLSGHMFLILPSLNNIEGMWNTDGSININVEDEGMRNTSNNEIKKVVKNLVDDKLKLWEKYNFYSYNEKGKVELDMLDTRVLNAHNILRGIDNNNIPKAMATDIVFQYLIANANFYTGIVGDPANFFKSSTFKNTLIQLIKDNVVTSVQGQDIALVWTKFTSEQRIKTVQEVYDNIGKRLAMHIAPGKSIADYSGNVNYIFVNDKKVNSLSLDQYKVLLGEDAKAYSSKGILEEGTNAQEFTTFLEDMLIRFRSGQISEGLYNETKKIVEKELKKNNHYYFNNLKKELPTKELEEFNKLVLQVQKPVYSWFEVGPTGITPMYIKTSSYPLLPELTVGNELDKIRIMMEKNGIQRLAFPSGTKLGMPNNPVTLWNEDGTVKSELTEQEIKGATKLLPRKGFRLQQEIPYEALKDFINRVSQADKNLFINMQGVEGFEYNGNTYNGANLQKEYEKNYGELYKLGFDNLVRELDIKFDDNGSIISMDRLKIKEVLLEEAVKRDYAINDIEALDLDDALDYIAFMPLAAKYETLLNAIVKNRVLQMKFKGKSFVLSTEEGYQQDKNVAIEDLKDKEGIIYTDKWKGTLDPGHFTNVNGKKLTGEELAKAFKEGTAIVKKPAQILIPWKFQWNGELLHIDDFINPKTDRIDTSKLPEELLQIFGMRIPNQGPNSQSWIEIVGFLPKKSGGIVVATRDYLAQMGSDFDVDKLYTYMYNYYFNGTSLEKIKFNTKEEIMKLQNDTLEALAFQLDDGKAKVLDAQARYLKNVNKVWNQALQNKQLDIHIAIHKNTNPLVQKQILEPLGFWEFKRIADEIAEAREYNPTFTAMSDAYQKFKRLNAASGKTLVGDFANLLMFTAVAQGKDLYLYNKSNDKRVNINFGGVWSNGDLSNALTLRSKNKLVNAVHKATNISKKDIDANIEDYMPKILEYLEPGDIVFRSSVASGLLSAAVDNEKEQILDKLFMNSNTSRYVKLLTALGYEEEVGYFVKQPIIVDYFNELKKLRSSLEGYNLNAEREAKEFVMKKYAVKDYSKKLYEDNFANGKGLTVKAMKDSILNPTGDFNYIQLAVFEQLEYIKKYADDLQSVQSAINTDSKGLDKNLLETISKENAVDRIYLKSIKNAETILEGTVNGFATNYGLKFNNKLWSNLFPYQQQGVEYMFDTVEKILGKEEVGIQGKAALKAKVWKKFKSYIYTLKELGMYTDNINTERERLFIDREGNKSLATKIKEIKLLPEFANHPFIFKLIVDKKTSSRPSIIKMDAGFDQVGELLTVQGAMDLYVNDRPIKGLDMTTRELFVDLVKASYLSGGIQEAVQYIKFMPVSYLYSTGFTENLSNKVRTKFFEDTTKLDIPNENMPYWMLPNFIIQYFQHDTRGLANLGKEYSKDIKIRNLNKNLSTDVKVVEFSLMKGDYYVTRGTKQVAPEFLVIPATRERGLDSNILFIYIGNKDEKGYPIYHRIPNYGEFAFDEFSYGQEFYNSMINTYNTGGYIFNQPVVSHPEDTSYSESYTNPETEVLPQEVLELPKSGDVKVVGKVLENIALHSEDIFYQELSKEYSKHTDKLNVGTINSGNYSDAVAGRYSTSNNIYINLSHEQNNDVDGMSETILHEVTHGFVNKILETPINKLNPDTKEAVADLTRLHSIYKDRVIKKVGLEKYNEIVAKFKDKDRDSISKLVKDNTEAMSVYATTNIKEFAAMAMSNLDTQKDLNSIDDPSYKGRGLLDRFVEIVQKLLNSIGIPIKENSLLAGAVQDIVVIINNNGITLESKILEEYELFPGIYANEGQINAINKLQEFLSSNKIEFILSGRAGTGKTTILNKVFKEKILRIGGATVSHKAKKILGNSIGRENVRTLASMLAIKLDESTGKFTPDDYARKLGKIPIRNYNIIIIDEASMISPEMYKEIINLKNPNAKVIFVGDKAQLPPIGENVESPVFNIKNSVELVEITRQAKNSPILNVASKIADNTNSSSPILRVITKEDRINKFDSSTNSALLFTNNKEEALNSFVTDFKKSGGNTNYVKIVTFNNEKHNSPQSVKNINFEVRELLWKDKSKNQFNEGELLTAYDSYQQDTGQDKDEQLINNSEDYIVISQEKVNKVKGIVKVKNIDKGIREFIYEYDIVYLTLKDSDGRDIPNQIPVIAQSSLKKFEEDLNNLWGSDKQLAFGLKGKFANLQYGYAITSHKAQGSTYINTYVFEDNILGSTNVSSVLNKNRSLYVGVSRASKKLVIISGVNNNDKLESFDGEVVETLFPGNVKNEMDKILQENGELNKDGSRKLLLHDKNGSSENYKLMLKRAQKINAKDYSYKAVVANTLGEEVTIRSGRLYYYIKLIPRELSIKQKMNSISQQEIFDRIRKCR